MSKYVDLIKEYAIKNYETDGWDYIVECYEDNEIEAIIKGAGTLSEAIARVHEEVKCRDDYRKDIQGA